MDRSLSSSSPRPVSDETSGDHLATVVLDDIGTAPPFLELLHGVCIPCKSRTSRCDDHDSFTRACLQCRKLGLDCEWQCRLSRAERRDREESQAGKRSTSRSRSFTAGRSDADANANDDEDDGRSQVSASSTTTAGKRRRRKRYRTRSRSVPWASDDGEDELNRHGKPPVPSAGWPPVVVLKPEWDGRRIKGTIKVTKQSKKLVKQEPLSNDEGAGGASETRSSSSSDSEADAASYERADGNLKDNVNAANLLGEGEGDLDAACASYLARMASREKGDNFLNTESYTSLLASMRAEELADLARALYWWETSHQAALVRSSHPNVTEVTPAEWQGMSHLRRLLAENVQSWSLWPRKATLIRSETSFLNNAESPITNATPSIAEAIVATILDQLSRSSFYRDTIASISPTHIKLLLQTQRTHNIPFILRNPSESRSIFTKAPYAVPTISVPDLFETYLNKETLILDHLEAIQAGVGVHVRRSIDAVLLRCAEMRQPKGMRRHLRGGRKRESKGKERAREVEHEAGGENDNFVDVDIQGARSGIQVDGRGGEEEVPADSAESKPRKPFRAQKAGGWQQLMLAAITVDGIPRSVIESTLLRLGKIYGPSEIDFMKRFDAMHGTPDAKLVPERYSKLRSTSSTASPAELAKAQYRDYLAVFPPVPKIQREGRKANAGTDGGAS